MLMLGFGVVSIIAIGIGEHVVEGNLQQAQDQLRQWFTWPFFILFGAALIFILFCQANILAKRIRDIGLPGWWSIFSILVLEITISWVLSSQHDGGVHSLFLIAAILVPSDSFDVRQAKPDE